MAGLAACRLAGGMLSLLARQDAAAVLSCAPARKAQLVHAVIHPASQPPSWADLPTHSQPAHPPVHFLSSSGIISSSSSFRWCRNFSVICRVCELGGPGCASWYRDAISSTCWPGATRRKKPWLAKLCRPCWRCHPCRRCSALAQACPPQHALSPARRTSCTTCASSSPPVCRSANVVVGRGGMGLHGSKQLPGGPLKTCSTVPPRAHCPASSSGQSGGTCTFSVNC